jgi:ATP diphosphatase
MADVISGIATKLESRHPHVFAGLEGVDAEGALKSWAALKKEERVRAGQAHPSAIDGVPTQAPALLRAERTGEKAARVGFDWPDIKGVRAKLTEELAELDEAIAAGDRTRTEEELGDVLFSLCNLARWLQTPAEDALRGAIGRFERRFRHLERALEAQGRTPAQSNADELDRLWNEAKRNERAL